MKNPFKRFCWFWIKNQANKIPNAQCLVKLSIEFNDEPHRMAGKLAIYEWLDEINVPFRFHEIVRELETEYHNIGLIGQEGGLNPQEDYKTDEMNPNPF